MHHPVNIVQLASHSDLGESKILGGMSINTPSAAYSLERDATYSLPKIRTKKRDTSIKSSIKHDSSMPRTNKNE